MEWNQFILSDVASVSVYSCRLVKKFDRVMWTEVIDNPDGNNYCFAIRVIGHEILYNNNEWISAYVDDGFWHETKYSTFSRDDHLTTADQRLFDETIKSYLASK